MKYNSNEMKRRLVRGMQNAANALTNGGLAEQDAAQVAADLETMSNALAALLVGKNANAALSYLTAWALI